ncbi:hypothetical protein ALC56_09444 [Trachymyrmex septentrionalis]|uniref:Uncharacterized protein n=1 Tax=Trachymyrmex septentrionalis TaxID=34720 RepID=A0A195F7R8_9HYME|nr:hypothetical protein ALC56_09444 [Trachymyrmex septentrionalis]
MTAFAPGGRLWTRRSGYSSYSLFLRLRGPAVGTVGHASPSVHSGPASSSASLHDHTAITAHHDPTSAIVLAGIVDSTHLSEPSYPLCPMDNPATERKIKSWGTAMQLEDRERREANRRTEKEIKEKREKGKEQKGKTKWKRQEEVERVLIKVACWNF